MSANGDSISNGLGLAAGLRPRSSTVTQADREAALLAAARAGKKPAIRFSASKDDNPAPRDQTTLLVADLGLQAERSAGVAREREALISAGLGEVQTSSKPNIDSAGDRIARGGHGSRPRSSAFSQSRTLLVRASALPGLPEESEHSQGFPAAASAASDAGSACASSLIAAAAPPQSDDDSLDDADAVFQKNVQRILAQLSTTRPLQADFSDVINGTGFFKERALLSGSAGIETAIQCMETLFDAQQGVTLIVTDEALIRVCSAGVVPGAELPLMNHAPELVIAQALFWLHNAFDYISVPGEDDTGITAAKRAMIEDFRELAKQLRQTESLKDLHNQKKLFHFNDQVLKRVMIVVRQSEKEVRKGLKEARMWSALAYPTRSILDIDDANHTFELNRPCAEPSVSLLVDSALALVLQQEECDPKDHHAISSTVQQELKKRLGEAYDATISGQVTEQLAKYATSEDMKPAWWGTCSPLTLRLFKAHCASFIRPRILVPTQFSYVAQLFEEPMRNTYEVRRGVILKDGSFFETSRMIRGGAPTSRKPRSTDEKECRATRHNMDMLQIQYPGHTMIFASLLSDNTPGEPDKDINDTIRVVLEDMHANEAALARKKRQISQPASAVFQNTSSTAKYVNRQEQDASGILTEFVEIDFSKKRTSLHFACAIIQAFARGVTPVQDTNPFKGLSRTDFQAQSELLQTTYHEANTALNRLKLECIGLCDAKGLKDPEVAILAQRIQFLDALLTYKVLMVNQHHKRTLYGASKKQSAVHVFIPTAVEILNGGYDNVQHNQCLLALETILAGRAHSLSLWKRIYFFFCKSGKDRTGNMADLISTFSEQFDAAFFNRLERDDALRATYQTLFVPTKQGELAGLATALVQTGYSIGELQTTLCGSSREQDNKYQLIRGCLARAGNQDLVSNLDMLRDALSTMSYAPTRRPDQVAQASCSVQHFETVRDRVIQKANTAFLTGQKGGTRTCYGVVPQVVQNRFGMGAGVATWRKMFSRSCTWLAKQNKIPTCASEKQGVRNKLASLFSRFHRSGSTAAAEASDAASRNTVSWEYLTPVDDGLMRTGSYTEGDDRALLTDGARSTSTSSLRRAGSTDSRGSHGSAHVLRGSSGGGAAGGATDAASSDA